MRDTVCVRTFYAPSYPYPSCNLLLGRVKINNNWFDGDWLGSLEESVLGNRGEIIYVISRLASTRQVPPQVHLTWERGQTQLLGLFLNRFCDT